jgi:glycolate oxidase iron-sulfur subunit
MKTEFSLAQLADPDIAEADKILRACVHCGFCTATCPTYVRDSIAHVAGSISSRKCWRRTGRRRRSGQAYRLCLSYLACMTTCPSGENCTSGRSKRVRIERDYSRPLAERALRAAGLGAEA